MSKRFLGIVVVGTVLGGGLFFMPRAETDTLDKLQFPTAAKPPPDQPKGNPAKNPGFSEPPPSEGVVESQLDCGEEAEIKAEFLIDWPPKPGRGFPGARAAIDALGPEYRLNTSKFAQKTARESAVEFVQEREAKTLAAILAIRYKGNNWIVRQFKACQSLLDEQSEVPPEEIEEDLRRRGEKPPKN